jgi:transposase
MPKLSIKEAEKRINRVYNLKRRGYTNPQVAEKLGICLKTVKRYLYEYPKGKNQAKKPIESDPWTAPPADILRTFVEPYRPTECKETKGIFQEMEERKKEERLTELESYRKKKELLTHRRNAELATALVEVFKNIDRWLYGEPFRPIESRVDKYYRELEEFKRNNKELEFQDISEREEEERLCRVVKEYNKKHPWSDA